MALKRTQNQMPDFIRNVLSERGLMEAYRARPAYQQNDYIGSLCVTRAKQEPTKQKRLEQIFNLRPYNIQTAFRTSYGLPKRN